MCYNYLVRLRDLNINRKDRHMKSEYITHDIYEHGKLINFLNEIHEDILDIEFGNDINCEKYFSKVTTYSMPI